MFQPTLKTTQKFRFQAGGAVTRESVTRGMLLNLVTMATTTTNQFRLYGAVKLKSVSLWAVPSSTSTTQQTASLEWKGTYAPSIVVADTSMGNARPLYVHSRPQGNSSERWWSIFNQQEAEVLFQITGPAGMIIDVELTMRLQDDEGPMAGENGTGAASTVGVIYINYLDGFAAKQFLPLMANPVLP
jgi:hypothetical protein